MEVMIYPAEVRALALQSGLSWEEVAEPYPEQITLPSGTICTFEWAIRKREGRCIFLEDGCCRVYSCRPWICRTFPFALSGKRLLREECPGLGRETGESEALALAQDLISRREIERGEEDQVRHYARSLNRVHGSYILIDGEGMRVLDP